MAPGRLRSSLSLGPLVSGATLQRPGSAQGPTQAPGSPPASRTSSPTPLLTVKSMQRTERFTFP